MRWDKRFLKTPLHTKDSRKAWSECEKVGLPYAVFRKGRKYGWYQLDLLPVERSGLRLSDEGQAEIMGIFEAAFARWCLDKRLPKSKSTVAYHTGPTIISIEPVPMGEEVYLHHAICRVLAEHLAGGHELRVQRPAITGVVTDSARESMH